MNPDPCTPCANWYQAGDTLRIQSIEWGHVFAYWDGPKAPNMQYPICIGCGRPYHVVRYDVEKTRECVKVYV